MDEESRQSMGQAWRQLGQYRKKEGGIAQPFDVGGGGVKQGEYRKKEGEITDPWEVGGVSTGAGVPPGEQGPDTPLTRARRGARIPPIDPNPTRTPLDAQRPIDPLRRGRNLNSKQFIKPETRRAAKTLLAMHADMRRIGHAGFGEALRYALGAPPSAVNQPRGWNISRVQQPMDSQPAYRVPGENPEGGVG